METMAFSALVTKKYFPQTRIIRMFLSVVLFEGEADFLYHEMQCVCECVCSLSRSLSLSLSLSVCVNLCFLHTCGL